MKKKNVAVTDQVKGCAKRLFAYGIAKEIQVRGTFNATVKYHDITTKSTIYVCTMGTQNILSRETAIKLNLITFNICKEINMINCELPKMKGL